jgi:hypothetical protein
MPYEEPTIINEDGETTNMPGMEWMPQQNIAPYTNPENVFIKHLTEIQCPEDMDEEFKKKWIHRFMFSGKEKSTGFIENPKTCKLNSLMRMNLGLMESLGVDNLLWSTVFDNIDIMKVTHGQHGNLINAITTKRQEFTDKTQQLPTTWKDKLSGLFKNEPENPQMQRY